MAATGGLLDRQSRRDRLVKILPVAILAIFPVVSLASPTYLGDPVEFLPRISLLLLTVIMLKRLTFYMGRTDTGNDWAGSVEIPLGYSRTDKTMQSPGQFE